MRVTILGCGTSTGVPLIGCRCGVCRSKNPKNKRLRASVWIEVRGKSFLIDTSPDFRQQALRAGIQRIDAVLYTHPHADHLHGIDDLRSYNFIQSAVIPAYANTWTCDEIRKKFSYIFRSIPAEGGGKPSIDLHCIEASDPPIEIQGIPVLPLSLAHGSKETLAYRIDSVAYVVDCSYISPPTLKRLEGLSLLILDCLRLDPHDTHFHLEKSLQIIETVKPKRAILTHLGHDFDYPRWKKKLPRGVSLAYDGLKIEESSS